jgi:signal transduction histidine kinase
LKLTLKLPALVIGAILLTAIASGAVSIVIGRNTIRQATLEDMLHGAEMYAGAVLSHVDGARALLTTTAALPQLGTAERAREVAALVLAQSAAIEYVMLLNLEGTVAMVEPRALEAQLSQRNLSFSAWFGEARRANRTIVSDLHISPVTQRPAIVIATPVRSAGGQPVGVWAGALKLDQLSKIGGIASDPAQRTEAGFLTDRRGLIIAHQNRPVFVESQTDFSSVHSVKEALAGRPGASEFYNAIESEKKIAGYVPLPDLGWAAVYRVPAAVALAPATELTRNIVSTSLVLALLIGIGVYVLARKTFAPLARLTAAAQTIGTGDFSRRIEASSADEIGQLTREFNRMVDAIAKSDVQLQERALALARSNAELETTEQRLDLALRHSEMGVWDLDLIHDTAWRTLQHDRIFGYESAPAKWGQEIALRHVVPEDREHFVRCFQEASGTGRFFLECRVIRPDQSIHWIQAKGQVLAYEDGRPARMLGTVVDITKQRDLLDALEKSVRALARSNSELEQFAYVASHDLQEPLRMVVGYVQLLERRLADKLDKETREFMGFAVDGALRMQGLIHDILAYSRVSSKGEPLVPVDSAAALQEALDMLAGRIAETEARVDAQPLPRVMADRAQLMQLFQNLIGNALKFCKDRAPRVRVEATHQGGWWRFTVADNGIGIAPEYRAQLFVVFKRLHTRREYAGTGIGLAICKRIVERHGGQIGIESAPAGGALFWFTLPEEKLP